MTTDESISRSSSVKRRRASAASRFSIRSAGIVGEKPEPAEIDACDRHAKGASTRAADSMVPSPPRTITVSAVAPRLFQLATV